VPRLFLAVWPPPAFAEQLAALPRGERRGVKWVAPENWHVTLRFLGEAEPDEVRTRLDGTALPATTATLGPVVQRLGRGLVVVPVGGLDELAAVVETATADVGRQPDDRTFRGHITLARFRPSTRCPLAGSPIHAVDEIDEVVLAESRLSHTGAAYDVIARWSVA
jgi:RNA 2',3'-cyclic 3'-phosphodiesterase